MRHADQVAAHQHERREQCDMNPLMLDFCWVVYDDVTVPKFAERMCPMGRTIAFAFLGFMLVAGTATVMTIELKPAKVCSGPNC
jgi:hypothetical protein